MIQTEGRLPTTSFRSTYMNQGRVLDIHPNPKQYEAWKALQDPKIKEIHYGGAAGGGKSWLGCESRLVRALAYPGYKSLIGRNELTRLLASTFVTFQKVCQHHGLKQGEDWVYNGQYHYISFPNGSRIDLLDLAYKPSDPMYERLGSMEFTDGGFIDEAGEVPFMAIDILQSRAGRHKNKEFGLEPDSLYTYNPNKGWVYRVYKQFQGGTLPEDIVFIQALYQDNPYTADVYGRQLARIKDPAMRARLMLGSFDYDSDPASLINDEAANDIFTNTVPDGEKALTGDIARHGVDKTVFYLWKGMTIYGVRIYAKQDIAVTAQKASEICAAEHIPYSRAVYDEDGVGGGVVDLNKGCRGFIGNSSALLNPTTKEPENYANLKSQCSYKLAEVINSHGLAVKIEPGQFISEVPGITFEVWRDMFLEELAHIKSKDIDKDRKLRVQAKEDVKDAIQRSPDFSDTAMMRMMLEYPQKNAPATIHVHKPAVAGFARSNVRRSYAPSRRYGSNARG